MMLTTRHIRCMCHRNVSTGEREKMNKNGVSNMLMGENRI